MFRSCVLATECAFQMAGKMLAEWVTLSLGPSGWAILFTAILAVTLPLLLHLFLYRQKATTALPTFLLTGPSGGGKTTILTLFERGTPARTHTSQTPLAVECTLPAHITAASNQFRSVNDPSSLIRKKFLLVDTPGHGKLRHFALGNLVNPQDLKGILFVVDAATLSVASASEGQGDSTLAESAEYLHDILLVLQKRYTSSTSSKGPTEIPVVIAANKSDLFTALPPKLVKTSLEAEITRLRNTRSKGLLDSGIGVDDVPEDDDERQILGGAGEGKFEFALMDEYNVPIEIIGGSAALGSEDATNVDNWRQWIGNYL